MGFGDLVDVEADHGFAEAAGDLGEGVGVVVEGGGLDDRFGALGGVAALEDAGADEDAFGAELHHHGCVGGRRDAACGEQDDGQLALLGDLTHEGVGSLHLLGRDVEFVLGHRRQAADLAADLAHVRRRVRHVAGARFTLGADHRGALVDASQRLTEVGRAAHERHVEGPLVDVVGVVGGREHLRFVDVVDAERLQHLRFDEVPDARLRHDGDRHGLDDAVDHVGITHARDTALRADVGGHTFEGHDGDGSCVLGDLRLLGGDDVHDDAALEHVGHAALDAVGRHGGVLFGACSAHVFVPLSDGRRGCDARAHASPETGMKETDDRRWQLPATA